MAPRVLIADKMSARAVDVLTERGVEADVKTGLDRDQLIEIINDYDGVIVRSATKITEKVIEASERLKVVGRAGIGVDNIDVKAATAKGIIVMNAPSGNAITTAEHAISMMMALARQVPQANASTHAGKWEKSRFMGMEITGKTLGIVGCGNIGSIVAERALGLKMRVIAFDPFLTDERAVQLGVEKVSLDDLLARADIISLHTPLTDKTRGIIDAAALAKTRKGVRIINCARGGLVVEADLKAAIESGHVAGAALDVFEEEPAKENVLFGMEEVVCTPHLGASTTEAQENVAVQIAEQVANYLLHGAVANALNMPSISADEAPRLKPFIKLAEQLGSFAGQLTESSIKGITIEYAGDVAEMNTKALSSALLAGLLAPILTEVNMVNAPIVAESRGMAVDEVRQSKRGVYDTYIRLIVRTERQQRSVAGTVFSDGKPRIIQIKGINMEAELGPHMLYVTNEDKPGFIGALGMALGDGGINIATFNLGRQERGGDAIALIEVDDTVQPDLLAKVRALPHVRDAKFLTF
ncbi:phosphoglycerate dehydrogenase [Kaustia mangrovi]|uniref:D-3-phosphoglycerate dehydrogenase n=1 Tax=Kaustia mangrovi TaxID=2593653 RepID=A0A7S8C5X7_9HYPH|nr:phosphoglycerate dehydrogenase [Kaustia mangrovi]QPC43957.1 phosphoglycerate dehydrogenase [Kaustia mangrovi]